MDSTSKSNAYHLIMRYHDAGLFSIINKLMNYLQTYKPIYKISWEVYSNQDSYGESNNYYGEGEILGKLFEPYINTEYKDYNIIDIECYAYVNQNMTGTPGNYIYTNEGCINQNISVDWRYEFNTFWNTYIKIKPDLQIKIDKIKNEIKSKNKSKVITILVRHDYLKREQLYYKLPSYDIYDDTINTITNNDLDDTLLICCTAVKEAYNHFSKKYENNSIIIPECNRTSNSESESHRIPNQTDNDLYEAFLTVIYLSVGDYFIHPNSNMSTAVIFINPKINNIFLVG